MDLNLPLIGETEGQLVMASRSWRITKVGQLFVRANWMALLFLKEE